MMDDQERQISDRLHQAADQLDVPSSLLERVRRTTEQPTRNRHDQRVRSRWLMPAAVAAAVVVLTAGVLLAVSPGHDAVPADAEPVDRHRPIAVVTAYLAEAQAGDCTSASTYWVPATNRGPRGDLCEQDISEFTITRNADPEDSATSDTVAASLTTDGSADGSIPEGPIVWFFRADKQADGTWLITEGGSG